MSSARQRLIHAVSEGIVEQAERIAKEEGLINAEDVIGAWLTDLLYHDMRDSTIRWLHRRGVGAKERVGLPMPERETVGQQDTGGHK